MITSIEDIAEAWVKASNPNGIVKDSEVRVIEGRDGFGHRQTSLSIEVGENKWESSDENALDLLIHAIANAAYAQGHADGVGMPRDFYAPKKQRYSIKVDSKLLCIGYWEREQSIKELAKHQELYSEARLYDCEGRPISGLP